MHPRRSQHFHGSTALGFSARNSLYLFAPMDFHLTNRAWAHVGGVSGAEHFQPLRRRSHVRLMPWVIAFAVPASPYTPDRPTVPVIRPTGLLLGAPVSAMDRHRVEFKRLRTGLRLLRMLNFSTPSRTLRVKPWILSHTKAKPSTH